MRINSTHSDADRGDDFYPTPIEAVRALQFAEAAARFYQEVGHIGLHQYWLSVAASRRESVNSVAPEATPSC